MVETRTRLAFMKRVASAVAGSAIALSGLLGGAQFAFAGSLTSATVTPASLVAGSSSTVTVAFTTATNLPNNGKIKITFGNGFNVGTISAPVNCTGFDGTFGYGTSGNVVTLTRNADGGVTGAPASISCTLPTITNPNTAGSTGTYTIETTDNSNVVIDSNSAVAASTISAAVLTSTNVQPASLRTATTNTVTVSFTLINALENNGKVKVNFPSGFDVSGATSGACSTMDGSFTTNVSSQTVTLTRSGGSSEPAGAQTCTIGGIRNPVTAGTSSTYQITTTNSADAVHDSATAVTADTFTAGGTNSTSDNTTSTALTYGIAVSTPEAADAFMPGDEIAIDWSTSGTGTIGFVNLYYSVDSGVTWETIATNVANDGSYAWTAPDVEEQNVMVRAVGTDLVTTLATDDSDAFSIGTEADTSDEDTDTSDDTSTEEDGGTSSVELLADGTYMMGESWDTVYMIENGMRRPFLDSQTFFTYQNDFSNVVTVDDDELANYTIGEPMLPNPGTVLVKIQSVNSVYAMDADGSLRWISSEDLAEEMYGSDWADYVIDVPVTAWGHFTFGDDIESVDDLDVDLGDMETRDDLNSR